MKKSLIIFMLVVSVIFISGCTGDGQTDADALSPDLIIKPSDVPGLTLDDGYTFYEVQTDTTFVDGGKFDRYKENLSVGYRNVGEKSKWEDQSGRVLRVELLKYDSNFGLENIISQMKYESDTRTEEIKQDEAEYGVKIGFGDPNIGNNSFYVSSTDVETGIQSTNVFFVFNNNIAVVDVTDDGKKSYNDAIRISKLMVSKLN